MHKSQIRDEPTAKQIRAAQLATALAQAVRSGNLEAADALRVIRHELRRLQTNRKHLIPFRSERAHEILASTHDPKTLPRNSDPEALHADHVWNLTPGHVDQLQSVEEWIGALSRMQAVVCVTARENYQLTQKERDGVWGPDKYKDIKIVDSDGRAADLSRFSKP